MPQEFPALAESIVDALLELIEETEPDPERQEGALPTVSFTPDWQDET